MESDTTGGLNRNGTVVVHVPYAASRSTINNTEASWIRVRLLPPRPDQRGYSASPQVRGLTTEIIGGTVPASHGVPLHELVGRSDGRPQPDVPAQQLPPATTYRGRDRRSGDGPGRVGGMDRGAGLRRFDSRGRALSL